jgi:hypothetical protein
MLMQVILSLAMLAFFACFLYPVMKPAFSLVRTGLKIRKKAQFKMEGVLAKATQRLEEYSAEAVEAFASLPVIPEALVRSSEPEAAIWTGVLHFDRGANVITKGSLSKMSAYVLLRGYSNRVERDLVVTSPPKAKQLGSNRMKLKAFDGYQTSSSLMLTEDTQKVVAPILNGGGVLLNEAVQEPKPVSVSVKEAEKVEEKKEEEFAPASETKPKDRVMPSWKGRLVEYGYGHRALSKRDDSEDDPEDSGTVRQYRVVLEYNGQQEHIWGQDLHRALKDSHAIKGDLIEVIHTGKKPCGKGRIMNLYSIKKLA